MRRAISLAGGGPAVGLSLGAVDRLRREPDIDFEVWTTACIGAWVAVLYNQAPAGREYTASVNFFRQVFRSDREYDRFPIASIFAPNWQDLMGGMLDFCLSPGSYRNLVVPEAIIRAVDQFWQIARNPRSWTPGVINPLILNSVLAVNPISRFLTSLIYLSPIKGSARVYYPDSPLLQQIDFQALHAPDKPTLYHNAYNVTRSRLDQFSNKTGDGLPDISAQSLCACSALPYIVNPVQIDGDVYTEGAAVDTVNFKGVLDQHPDLEEVWVSRLLTHLQIREPRNMVDALNNLVMLFAATTSEDDVKLFKYHLMEDKRDIRVVEFHVSYDINYDWTYSNLNRGIADGQLAAEQALERYRRGEIWSAVPNRRSFQIAGAPPQQQSALPEPAVIAQSRPVPRGRRGAPAA